MTTSSSDCAALMPISDEEFELLRGLIYQRFGINLTEQKKSLLVGRMQKLLKRSGYPNFKAYYEDLQNDQSEKKLSELVDRVSTNHTYFNRERTHFDYFSQTALPAVVQRLRKAGEKDLRVWCAGCSSGEEAYMLLMLMQEYLGSEYPQWNCGLLATDISSRVLDIAGKGVYSEEKIQALPQALRNKYVRPAGDGQFAFSDALRKEAVFRRFNLMNERFPFKNPFHIIFCRNVMIYFDAPTRLNLVNKFHKFMHPGGYLFIGHSETLGRQQDLFKYLVPAVYQKELTS
ncbi:chemotaxis protein CheR [Syntrophotalea acetylenivorans]|uniref:protein-glutamate O-methyltransferase n=1 Tax=Syntrophotalea acetylenivorans TaxID=1842532 RepID=A0A1L3GN41_9BACT|nr:protein-glutamate O-methyltransferase CheR [Syntrophotalea acetylenivorans]APG27310.1 chemotaxis protein CheR [Syntrophotalea acetylenivorans]